MANKSYYNDLGAFFVRTKVYSTVYRETFSILYFLLFHFGVQHFIFCQSHDNFSLLSDYFNSTTLLCASSNLKMQTMNEKGKVLCDIKRKTFTDMFLYWKNDCFRGNICARENRGGLKHQKCA